MSWQYSANLLDPKFNRSCLSRDNTGKQHMSLTPTFSIVFNMLQVITMKGGFNSLFSGCVSIGYRLIIITSKYIRLIARHANLIIPCTYKLCQTVLLIDMAY